MTGFCFGSVLGLKDPFVKFDADIAEDDDVSRLINYTNVYHQLSQAYKEMAKLLHPVILSADLFRHTCSLGLLRHDLDDSFQDLMDSLELDVSYDQISESPIKLSGSRFRYKLMAQSINARCMFAIQQTVPMGSTMFAGGVIGIAPPEVV